MDWYTAPYIEVDVTFVPGTGETSGDDPELKEWVLGTNPGSGVVFLHGCCFQ